MVVQGPVHVAAGAVDRLQRCSRCSTELAAGPAYALGALVAERSDGALDSSGAIQLEAISRNGVGTIYLCDEQPPAAFI